MTSDIDEEFKAQYRALLAKYGNDSLIPKEEKFIIGETARAKHVIRINGGVADPHVLSQYSIPQRIIEALCGEGVTLERRTRRVDKRRAMEQWVSENIGAVVTPQELADAGDVSYATAIKFINENVGTFIKAGRGRYEVRDIKAEREASKKA